MINNSNEENSELEDGEIKDELEDISDSSLTEVLNIQKDLSDDDADLEKLRQEALKSLHEVDEVTEEELYRLEALKSLLKHTDFLPKDEESNKSAVKKYKRKKKHKQEPKHHKHSKRKKVSNMSISKQQSPKYLPETTLLLSGLSKEILDNSGPLPNTSIYVPNINKENNVQNVNTEIRSWYPISELALIDISSIQNIDSSISEINNCDINNTVNDCKTETSKLSPKAESVNNTTELIPKLKVLNQNIQILKKKFFNPNNQILKTKALKQNNQFKIDRVNRVPVAKLSSSPTSAKISKHKIVRNGAALPVKFDPKNNKKYKINSKYVLRKTLTPKNSSAIVKYNGKAIKSVYTMNRFSKYKYQDVKELIIKLDDEDSSNEENSNEELDVFLDGFAKKSNNVENLFGNVQKANHEATNFAIDEKPVVVETCDTVSCSKMIETEDKIIDEKNNKTVNNGLKIKSAYSSSVSEFPPNGIANASMLVTNRSITQNFAKQNQELKQSELSMTNTVQGEPTKNSKKPIQKYKTSVSQQLKITDTSSTDNRVKTSNLRNQEKLISNSKDTALIESKNEISVKSLQTANENKGPESAIIKNDTAKPKIKDESMVLVEAESNLTEIRSKLVHNLTELGNSMKQNTSENEKLTSMVEKLNILKSTITRFEQKIKQQKLKLEMSTSFMRSLFQGVTLRTKNCDQLKDLCTYAGKRIIGPHYKPPNEYEDLISEKYKDVDFSKCLNKLEDTKK